MTLVCVVLVIVLVLVLVVVVVVVLVIVLVIVLVVVVAAVVVVLLLLLLLVVVVVVAGSTHKPAETAKLCAEHAPELVTCTTKPAKHDAIPALENHLFNRKIHLQ